MCHIYKYVLANTTLTAAYSWADNVHTSLQSDKLKRMRGKAVTNCPDITNKIILNTFQILTHKFDRQAKRQKLFDLHVKTNSLASEENQEAISMVQTKTDRLPKEDIILRQMIQILHSKCDLRSHLL